MSLSELCIQRFMNTSSYDSPAYPCFLCDSIKPGLQHPNPTQDVKDHRAVWAVSPDSTMLAKEILPQPRRSSTMMSASRSSSESLSMLTLRIASTVSVAKAPVYPCLEKARHGSWQRNTDSSCGRSSQESLAGHGKGSFKTRPEQLVLGKSSGNPEDLKQEDGLFGVKPAGLEAGVWGLNPGLFRCSINSFLFFFFGNTGD